MSITVVRDTLVLDDEKFIAAWRWHYRRGFSIRIGTTLFLVQL